MRRYVRTMRLSAEEHKVMDSLYFAKRLGRDRYAQFLDELADLTDSFNAMTGRNESHEDVLHYIRTKAKAGKMSTFGDDWRRMPQLRSDFLSAKERDDLLAIRRMMAIAEDNIAHDGKLARELEKRFLAQTGRRVPALLLATYLLQLRKEGILETLDQRHEKAQPFGDIDEIAK